MVKCPNCEEEIEVLIHFQSGEKRYTYTGKEYFDDFFIEDNKTNDYECPECNKVLFTDEREAKKFLINEVS